MTLTKSGEAFLPEALATLQAADSAIRAARHAGGVAGSPLRLGLLAGIPDWFPGRLERALDVAAPGQDAVLGVGSTSDQLSQLLHAELDLAIVRCPVELPGGIELLALYSEELGVLMSAHHTLAARSVVRCSDLAGQELIWFPRARAPGYYDDVL